MMNFGSNCSQHCQRNMLLNLHDRRQSPHFSRFFFQPEYFSIEIISSLDRVVQLKKTQNTEQ